MGKKRKRSSDKSSKDVYVDVNPDATSEDYFNDEIDDFHNSKDNQLLLEGAPLKKSKIDESEEVLGVASDSDDDDERAAEYEKRLRRLGGISYKGRDDDSSDNAEEKNNDFEDDLLDSDVDDEDLEEHEALRIQKDSMKYLNEDDFFGFSSKQEPSVEQSEEKVTKRAESKIKKVESSTIEKVSEEFKFQLTQLFSMLNKSKEMSDKQKAKTQVILTYCINLNFLIAMNSDGEDIHNHPVVGRICHLKKVIENFEDFLQPSKGSMFVSDGDGDLDDSNDMEVDEDGVSHRPINKTIIQNRGKLPYRSKKLKNPRVRHRIKYRAAKIRRKGQMAEPRKEITKYQGELTGINPGIIRSVKFK